MDVFGGQILVLIKFLHYLDLDLAFDFDLDFGFGFGFDFDLEFNFDFDCIGDVFSVFGVL